MHPANVRGTPRRRLGGIATLLRLGRIRSAVCLAHRLAAEMDGARAARQRARERHHGHEHSPHPLGPHRSALRAGHRLTDVGTAFTGPPSGQPTEAAWFFAGSGHSFDMSHETISPTTHPSKTSPTRRSPSSSPDSFE